MAQEEQFLIYWAPYGKTNATGSDMGYKAAGASKQMKIMQELMGDYHMQKRFWLKPVK